LLEPLESGPQSPRFIDLFGGIIAKGPRSCTTQTQRKSAPSFYPLQGQRQGQGHGIEKGRILKIEDGTSSGMKVEAIRAATICAPQHMHPCIHPSIQPSIHRPYRSIMLVSIDHQER
jgi:hypothetical protein